MWRRSSRSNTGGTCVEVRQDLSAIRDSKYPVAVMPVSPSALNRLVASVRRDPR